MSCARSTGTTTAAACSVTTDYAEQAVYTTVAYCLTCGPVLREHLTHSQHVTYHVRQEADHPNADATMPEEDIPLQ